MLVQIIDEINFDKGLEGALFLPTIQSFNQGYKGFVSLTPKTRLIDYYIQQYGFFQYGRNLAIEGEASMNLIKKYLLS